MFLIQFYHECCTFIYNFLIVKYKCTFSDMEEFSCFLMKVITKDGALLGMILIYLLYWAGKELSQGSSIVLVLEFWAEYSQDVARSE